jgi:hypothetical protein
MPLPLVPVALVALGAYALARRSSGSPSSPSYVQNELNAGGSTTPAVAPLPMPPSSAAPGASTPGLLGGSVPVNYGNDYELG